MDQLHLDSDVPSADAAEAATPVDAFHVTDGLLTRRVSTLNGPPTETLYLAERVALPDGPVASNVAEQLFLRSKSRPDTSGGSRPVRIVDLFSGCGGLSLGLAEAARALGRGYEVALAVDLEAPALEVFGKNFVGARTELADIVDLLPGGFSDELTSAEKRLRQEVGDVDVLVGGPPCQGHSDLNNRTRRRDGKNQLYMKMIRAAEVFRPTRIMIENVPGAWNDRTQVVQRAIEALRVLGYQVAHRVVDMTNLGVPQRRRRLVVIGSLDRPVDLDALEFRHGRTKRGVDWAIGDLAQLPPQRLLDEPARSAPATRRRIDYLFDRDLYELPDSERPPCHAGGGHTYSSIYGRLRWTEPSQTITTGFYSMCMGRYVHPSERRTLTGHEAARLQYFPDFFDFSSVGGRGQLATMIGNAVPMRLSEVVGLEFLR